MTGKGVAPVSNGSPPGAHRVNLAQQWPLAALALANQVRNNSDETIAADFGQHGQHLPQFPHLFLSNGALSGPAAGRTDAAVTRATMASFAERPGSNEIGAASEGPLEASTTRMIASDYQGRLVQLPLPLIKNVVLIGGGHAHALVLRKWAMKPVAGVRLTVINPTATAPYTGMLPGFVAGHYQRDELDIDLVRLARFANARLVLGAATEIDRQAKTIAVAGRPPIPYDVCSINVGITSAMPFVPGFEEHGLAAKPLGQFARTWESFAGTHDSGTPSVIVIGGGVGGCELALAMHHRLSSSGATPQITVVEADQIVRDLGERSRAELRAHLNRSAIGVREDKRVTSVTHNSVLLDDGSELDADLVIGAAGARPYPWLAELGLQMHDGFIEVDSTLRSVTDPNIFVTGDCAHMGFAPRPKAGVFAVRQAPVLFANISAVLTNSKLQKFAPQDDYLKLISLGSKTAAADKFKRFVQGKGLWRLKDTIDRRFMDKLGDLPEMDPPKLPANAAAGLQESLDSEPPLCGGCGAKVGADILSGPLSALPDSTRTDVVRLPGDDAALLDFGATRQVITTDSVRSFTPDPFRMSKIAALHAMGDIWAMGASPQAVLVTVTLPQLARPLQSEWLAEIMAGAAEVLLPTGAEIVGGHTSMGAELSLGFSITGLLDAPAITLAGATVGQRLIVSRPVGSGLLFAGEMQRQARGPDVASLLATLELPQGPAAAILAAAGATAMTDVTGFGLAGHLFGMLRESAVAAELQLDEIPIFDGALDLAVDGLRSHLHAANQRGVPIITNSDDPRLPLIFDPQTAGGMLAAVPEVAADQAVADLVDAGFESAVIGTIHEGEPRISVR